MPLDMITVAPRANLVFSNFFAMIGSNHILFNAPLYFQVVHGDSPSVAGLRISLPALFTTICGVLTGFFLTWTGRMKAPQVVGSICMLVGGIATSLLWESTPQWLATLSITPPYAGQGFMFPATILGLLATSPEEDQATMMSTLILWRNLGIVFGVAISSLVLQNALTSYLELFISGPDKQEVIARVRMSVKAVLELKDEQRLQGMFLITNEIKWRPNGIIAVAAYSAALKLTFVSGLAFFVVVNLLILPVKLPRLGGRSVIAEEDNEA
jgi:hypothetical protein